MNFCVPEKSYELWKDMRVNKWLFNFVWICLWESLHFHLRHSLETSTTATNKSYFINDVTLPWHPVPQTRPCIRLASWIQHHRWPDTSLPMELLNGAVCQLTSFISAPLTHLSMSRQVWELPNKHYLTHIQETFHLLIYLSVFFKSQETANN